MIARAVLCSFAALAASACSPAEKHTSGGATHAATVSGSVVDAENGEAVAGVRVEGPRALHASSDAHGRFELEGLVEGDSGSVVAHAKDGRKASIELRPLAPGRLEIVLRLR